SGGAAEGTDYSAIGTTVLFPAMSTSQTIAVDVTQDNIVEGNETVILTLTNATSAVTLGTPVAATVTIGDNDNASLAIEDVTVNESDLIATFTVTLTGKVQYAFSVKYETINNTPISALAGSDYTATNGILNFPAGSDGETKTFTVSINNDSYVEPTETYLAKLSNVIAMGNVTISRNQATGTIIDNDVATIAINTPAAVIEGNSITFTVTLTGDVQGGFTVAYNTTNGSAVEPGDYTAKTGFLSFTGTTGESKTFTVVTLNNPDVEPLETFNAVLGAFSNFGGGNLTIATGTGIGTIIDNDVNLTLDLPTTTTGQYSDVINLQATLLNGSGVGLDNQTITFKVGIQPITATTNASGVAANTLKLDQNPNTTTTDNVRATFAGGTFGGITYESMYKEKPFDVVKENAIVDYTGPEFVGESNPNLSSTPVLLSASIMDMPDGTGNEGDIRNTRVKFYDVNTMADISGWLTPGLVTPGDATRGIVTFTWNVPVPTSGYNTFTIGVEIDGTGYYVGGPAQSVLNVYRTTLDEFITGGGHIIPMDSKGEYASDPGQKVNFGYNVKWNKSLTNLQGNLNLIFRRGGQVYQIKTTATNSLSINTMNPCSQQATFTSKANLSNVTNSTMPVSIYGGLSLSVTMTDNGEPGVADMIGFTLYNGSTLIYSSSWPLNKTVELPLGGGNNVVHNGTVCNASTATTTAITSTKNPSVLGDMVTFKATVTESLTADPEGTITFKIDGANPGIIVPMVGGSASWSTDALTQGSHTITAVYASSNGFDSSTGSLNQTVSQTSVSLVSSANPSLTGTNVSFTATVIAGDDTKTVTFKDGSATIGTANISGGAATLNYTFSTAGTHSITAVYGTTTSAAYAQVVNSTTAVILSSSVNPSNQSQSVKFTATVNGGTGSVKFYDGTTLLTTVNLTGGVATYTTSALSLGSHVIKAQYFNTLNVLVSEASLTQVVTNLSIALTSSRNPAPTKTNITFTATVTGTGGFIPSGTVTFKNGATTLGTTTMSNGKATLTKSFTSATVLSITAVYNVTGLTSTVLLQTITSTKSASITTDVAEVIVEPTLKAYPNPFTERLNIEFSSATDTQAKLEIYSITGAKLETLFNGPVYGGLLYNFEYLPRLVSSQMVLYHLTIDGKTQVGKVIYNERR
ncbi:MAG: Ig-like domain repeat protein, partial [Bacteroidota bacterium]|nr:Ig-like domain repeat protein [Bacteroidota bacterium]